MQSYKDILIERGLAAKPAAEAPETACPEPRIIESAPHPLPTKPTKPPTCSAECYEVEPGKWIHRPWAGCTTIESTEPRPKVKVMRLGRLALLANHTPGRFARWALRLDHDVEPEETDDVTPEPQPKVAVTCWHCAGKKNCDCAACYDTGQCVTCKGTGQVWRWVQ